MPTDARVSPSGPAAAWSRVVAAFAARPLFGDLLRGVLLLVTWMTAIAIGLQLGWYPYQVGDYVVLGVICATAVALCRPFPLVGLIVVGVATAWPTWVFDAAELRVVPLVVAAFFATAGGARLAITAPLALAFTGLAVLPLSIWEQWRNVFDYEGLFFLYYIDPSTRLLAAVVVFAAFLLGISVFAQRRSLDALRERNAELVRLREVDAARIASEERTALARDIHDVVAHHVSAMVIRAQAADRVADSRPEELRETVRWITANGREALTAMRQVVRVLRADGENGAELSPADFATALASVITRVRDTGIDVRESIAETVTLSTIQQAVVLRVVQEALTNTMLHSDASVVDVSLRAVGDSIEVMIHDDGSPGSGAGESDGGNGLRGMNERVHAVGGTLTTGRFDRSGWTVRALLPVTRPELVSA